MILLLTWKVCVALVFYLIKYMRPLQCRKVHVSVTYTRVIHLTDEEIKLIASSYPLQQDKPPCCRIFGRNIARVYCGSAKLISWQWESEKLLSYSYY